jgi:hypothetical protein
VAPSQQHRTLDRRHRTSDRSEREELNQTIFTSPKLKTKSSTARVQSSQEIRQSKAVEHGADQRDRLRLHEMEVDQLGSEFSLKFAIPIRDGERSLFLASLRVG